MTGSVPYRSLLLTFINRRSKPALLAVLALSFLAASSAFALADLTVFGPKRYDRLKGSPTVYTDVFNQCNSSGQAVLKITNGDAKGTRIKSAVIYVNGVAAAVERDFKQQIPYFERNVTVKENNELKIVLKSGMQDDPNSTNLKDQSFLIIEITGKGCDSTPPILFDALPADGSLLNKGAPAVSVRYGDNPGGSGIDLNSVRLTLDGNDVTGSASVNASGLQYRPASNLPEGRHTATVNVSDLAHNPASLTWHFTTDTIAPAVKITSHQNNQYLNTPAITLSGTVDDPTSAVTVNGRPATVSGGQFSLANLALSEGPNTIQVEASDPAGNIGRETITLNLDTIAPIIRIMAPVEGASVKTPAVTVAGTVTETNPEGLWINEAAAPLTNGAFSLANVSLNEGSNTITVRARDKAGNESTATVSLILDTIAPVITITSPLDGSFVNTPAITVSGTVGELHPAGVWVNDTPVTLSGSGFQVTDVGLVEGSNSITVRATDLAGNESHATVTLVLDTARPTILIKAPEQNAWLNTPAVAVAGEISEPVTSVKVNGYSALITPTANGGASFSISSLPLAEGADTIAVEATDRAHNAGTASINVTLDTASPVVQITSPQANAYLNTQLIAVAASVNEPVIEATVNGTTAQIADTRTDFSSSGLPLIEGENTITALVKDRAGNPGTGSIKVNLDTVAPVVSITSPADNAYVNTASINVTGTVNEPATSVTVNGNPATITGTGYSIENVPLKEGQNTLTVEAIDRAGNKGSTVHTLTLDTALPVISITTPVKDSIVNTRTITVSGSVEEPNLESVWVNGTPVEAANNSFSFPNVALTEGTNTITIRAKDKAGNESTASVTVTLDTVAPVVSITAPIDGLLTKTAAIAVSGTVSELFASVAVNGTAALVSGQTYSASYPLSEGPNTLVVSATDRAGNSGSASVHVTLDSIAPAAPVLTQLPSPSPTLVVTVSGIAEAGSTVTLSAQKTGQSSPSVVGTVSASTQGTFSIANISLAEGTSTFTAVAADAAGNTSPASAPMSVERDTTPPKITVLSPANNSFTNQTSIAVTGTVDEPVELKINGVVVPMDGLTFTHTTGLSIGTNFIVISAKDLSGNVAPTVNWVVYLDQTPPSVMITSPLEGFLTRLPAVTVSGTVSEATGTVTVNSVPASVTNKTFTLANVTLREGQNTLTAQAADLAGNTGTASVGVFLDTQVPAVTVAAPSQAAAGTAVTISTTASDNHGLSVEEVTVNGVSIWSSTLNAELSTQNSVRYSLAPDLAQNSVVTVQARATDSAGNIGTATAEVRITSGPSGPGYVQGEVFDDTKGLLLTGATADILDADGHRAAQLVTLEDGGYFSELPAGAYRAVLSKTGFSSIERAVTIKSEQDSFAVDARLTPFNSQQSLIDSAGGKITAALFLTSGTTGTSGTSNAGPGTLNVELLIPANAVAEQADIRLTPISNQGLAGLLPSGWSPVAVADIHTMTTDSEPGTLNFGSDALLRVPVPAGLNLAASSQVTFAQYDTVSHQWIVQRHGEVTSDGAFITAPLSSTGQYALVLPDSVTIPAQGSALPALNSEQGALNSIVAAGRVVPAIAPAAAGVKAIGEVLLSSSSSALPSGTIITGKVTERFDLLSGEVVLPSDYTQDLVMYKYPCVTGLTLSSELGTPDSAKIGSVFPVTPSRDYTIIDLMKGKVGVEIALKQGTESSGTMVGTEGARLLDKDGNVLSVDQNSLSRTVPVETKTIAASTLAGVVGADFTLLRAVEVNLSNQTLTASAEMSIPTPANVSASLPIVVARAIEVRGVKKLKLAAFAKLSGSLITSSMNSVPSVASSLSGITQSGQYFFLQAKYALGFATGLVKDGAAKAYPSAQVTTSTCSLTDLTGMDGRYLVAATVANFTLTASDIYKNDKGTRVDVITAANEARPLDVTINVTPPSVVSVSPAEGTTGVDPKTQVVITMSEAVKPESVTNNTVYLEDSTGTNVPGVFSLSPDGTVVTFYPGQNFASETAYTLTVGHAVQDLQGYFMGQDYVSHFTIKDTTPPLPPPAGSITATFPDADGYITVTATQGSAEATGTVLIINDTTGEIVSVKPASNGSFTGKITAMLGNEIKILSMDASGNQTLITYITFKSDDGHYLVTAKGGIVEGEGGSKLIIADGALMGPTVIKITSVTQAQLPHPLPETARFLAAVNIDTGGAIFLKPPKLSVPAPANISDIPEGSRPFVSQPSELENADGTKEKVYVVHDSAKIVDGRVTTASPPFAGILLGGIFVFEFPYFSVAIVDGYTYRDTDGLDGYLPGVDQPIKNAVVRSPDSWEHIVYSRSDGSYALFTEVIYNVGAPCRDFRVTAIHPQTMNRVNATPQVCEPPYNIVHGLNFKLADGNTQFPDKTKPTISMNLQVASGQGPDARFTAGTVPVGTEIEVPLSVIDQQMGQVTLSVVYKTAMVTSNYSVPMTESGSSIHAYITTDNPVPIYEYSYQPNFGFPIGGSSAYRFKPNQEGTYVLTLEAMDAAGNLSTKSLTVRAVTPGTQPDGVDGAPTVDEIVPADGSKDIMATMVMSVAFNEPVNADTVTYNTLQLMDLGPIDPVTLVSSPTFTPVQVSATVSTALENGIVRAKLQPTANLMFGRQYQIRVTKQITDSVPNSFATCDAQTPPQPDGCLLPLDREYRATFTTRVPQGYTLATADQFQAPVGDIALYSSGTGSVYAYITAQDEGWRVVDVTNPATPFVTYKEKMSSGILSWKYRGVAVNQQTGILAITDWVQWNYSGGSMFGNVRFYDLNANPSIPPKVGQERLAEAYSGVPGHVAMDGNYAYVSTVMVGLQVVDVDKSKDYTDDYGASIVGVLDTVNLDQCPLPGATSGSNLCGSPHDIVAYRAGKALLTTFSGHLLLLDTSNPQVPQPVNFFYPAPTNASLYYEGAWTVGAVADYAYVDTDGNDQVKDLAVAGGRYPSGKLHIIDITDPYNPTVIGLVRDTQGGILSVFANEITIDKSSGLVYVTDNTAVYVIDIKNPKDPWVLNVITQTPGISGPLGPSSGIVEKAGRLYLTNSNTGLKIVDLHANIYVNLNPPPIIVVDKDGYTRADYNLSYSIVADKDAPVASASLTFSANGTPVTTVPAITNGEGRYTFPSGYRFTPAPNTTPDQTIYTVTLKVEPALGNVLQNQSATVVRTQQIPVATVKLFTDFTPMALDYNSDEVKFSNGSNEKKRYYIGLSSAAFLSTCSAITGTIRALDSADSLIAKPGDTNNVSYYPIMHDVSFTTDNGKCIAYFGKTDSSINRFIISNRSKQGLESYNSSSNTPVDLSKIAVLYGGLGKNKVQMEIKGVKNKIPIEPVGVVLLGIDGLRQDVLYPDVMDGEPFEDVDEPAFDYYVDAQTLPGLKQILIGNPQISLTQQYVMLPEVTAIFPSITFASWASIFTGKPPKETGILGNEFFARDRVNIDSSDVPGLDGYPKGLVTLDADGGSFRPKGGTLFALMHAIPVEPTTLLSIGTPYTTQAEKRQASAPSRVLLADPLWSDINTIVDGNYKHNHNYIAFECETNADECRTASVFNQYPMNQGANSVFYGVDRWSTASPSWANALALSDLFNSSGTAGLMDEVAANEAQDFIHKYFQNLDPVSKRKRFPAVFSVYLSGLDHDAHLHGLGQEYVNFFRNTVDPDVAKIAAALKAEDEFDNKIFIITADHGHTAMPTDLRYPVTMTVADPQGYDTVVTTNATVDMSCQLKTAGFKDPNVQAQERANNALHIWELANLFTQFNATAAGVEFKILAPKEIAEIPGMTGAVSETDSANIIAALNGPMAHIYVKGTDWNSDPDEQLILSVTTALLVAFKDHSGLPDEYAKILEKEFPNLLSSVDEILIRRQVEPGKYVYKVVENIMLNEQGEWVINSPQTASEYFADNPNYVDAVHRIENMNSIKRSGDLVLIMKDKTDDEAHSRYTTAYACESWHGSLNRSDSYVPFILSYPGGNQYELKSVTDAVCVNDACNANWVLPAMIKEIMRKQY